jgi:hypothetical protein
VRADTRREVAAATAHEKASTSDGSGITLGAGGMAEGLNEAISVCLKRSAGKKRKNKGGSK